MYFSTTFNQITKGNHKVLFKGQNTLNFYMEIDGDQVSEAIYKVGQAINPKTVCCCRSLTANPSGYLNPLTHWLCAILSCLFQVLRSPR